RNKTMRDHRQHGLAIKRVGIGPGARAISRQHLVEGNGAVGWNELIVDDDGLAASAGQSHREPVIVDRELRSRDKKKTRFRSILKRQDSAKNSPICVVTTAGEAEPPAQPITVLVPYGLSGRRVGNGGDRIAILAPDFLLSVFRVTRNQPGMHGAEAVNPSR